MSKIILNQKTKRPNVSGLENTSPSQPSSILIKNTEDDIILTVNKKWALNIGAYNLTKSLLIALSPLFLNDNKQIKENLQSPFVGFKNIAIFIENMPHYTGGRYSIFQQAMILSHFVKVTVYMNEIPPFAKDFEKYRTDNFSISIDKNFGLNAEKNEHDLVIGTPVTTGEFAVEYAKKFNIKSYLVLFESPNWISSMREGTDADEHFWSGYKQALLKCDKIIVPSYESKTWLTKWINRTDIDVVYPCMNEAEAKIVKNDNKLEFKIDDGKIHVLYIARMTDFKNPLSIIKKFPKDKYVFHFIGKIWENGKIEMDKMDGDGYEMIHYGKVNDKVKFKIIKSCDVMIFPTYFEGFGMPPMEALYFGKPVVTYDLPVLKEIYGDTVGMYFVPKGNEKLFVETVEFVVEDKLEITPPQHHHPRQCASKLLDILEIPKISTGTIVYNGDDYLKYALKSVYPVVWESIVVDGKVVEYDNESQFNNSSDNTNNIMKNLIKNDVLGKYIYDKTKKPILDKQRLQNFILTHVTGKYYVKLDHDEIWKPETLIQAINILEEKPSVTIIRMPFLHFWLSFKRIAKDSNGKWGTCHPRIWRFRKDFHHNKSFNYFEDKAGVKVASPFYQEETFAGDEFIYHFGWVRKLDIMLEKIRYYSTRGIEKFVIDTVSSWSSNDDKTQPTQDARSWAEDYRYAPLPKVLENHPYKDVNDIRKL